MAKHYLTQEALKKIKEELEHLKNVRRRELAEQLERAIGFGDISENAEFQEAKDAQAFAEGRILELEGILRSAVLLRKSGDSDKVQIGSSVFVSHDNGTDNFYIVSAEEVNPVEGKISFESPLGSALLNKPKGTTIEVNSPSGKRKYKILKIE